MADVAPINRQSRDIGGSGLRFVFMSDVLSDVPYAFASTLVYLAPTPSESKYRSRPCGRNLHH